MIENFNKLIKELSNKPSWGPKELTLRLQSISNEITLELIKNGSVINVNSTKKYKVEALKKYDILYLPLIGIPHYFMVHRVIEEKVYGVIFTSKDKSHVVIHEVQKDRILKGSYASNAYLCVDINEAKDAFIRTYEDKKEGSEIFKKVVSLYKKLFK